MSFKKTWSNRPWYGHWGLLNLYGLWWVKLTYPECLLAGFLFSLDCDLFFEKICVNLELVKF